MSGDGQAWWETPAQTGSALVRLGGEFDVASTPALERAYAADASRAGEPVAFDVLAVTFADTTLAHLLLDLDRSGAAAGAPVTVRVRRGSQVQRLLHLTGVDQRLSVLDEHGRPSRSPSARSEAGRSVVPHADAPVHREAPEIAEPAS